MCGKSGQKSVREKRSRRSRCQWKKSNKKDGALRFVSILGMVAKLSFVESAIEDTLWTGKMALVEGGVVKERCGRRLSWL